MLKTHFRTNWFSSIETVITGSLGPLSSHRDCCDNVQLTPHYAFSQSITLFIRVYIVLTQCTNNGSSVAMK